MKNLAYIFVLLAFLVYGCGSGFMANSDYDQSVNLRNYQTFKIVDDNSSKQEMDPILNNQFNKKRVATAITAQMKGRGYIEAETNHDLEVKFFTKVKDRQETQNSNNWGFWYPSRNTYTRNYEESTLIIDLVDAKEKKLVWQGWAVGEKEYNSKNVEQKVWDKVSEIFKTFPIQPKNRIDNDPISYKN